MEGGGLKTTAVYGGNAVANFFPESRINDTYREGKWVLYGDNLAMNYIVARSSFLQLIYYTTHVAFGFIPPTGVRTMQNKYYTVDQIICLGI